MPSIPGRPPTIELRQFLPAFASDFNAPEYPREHGLFLITCSQDDFFAREHQSVLAHAPGLSVL